jgi:hypothetical protein
MTNISGDTYEGRRGNGAWRPSDASESEALRGPALYRESDLLSEGFERKDEYLYRALNNRVLYFVRRYEHQHVPNDKRFRQGRLNEDGLEVADAGHSKVPYRWPELHTADPAKTVYWCEGEKDVETCIARGLVATTAAGQALSTTIAKALAGRDVVVLVDNDTKGEENAENAVNAFRHYAASVRVVRLPRLAHGEDITDWLSLREGSIDELKQIVEAASAVRAQEALDENAAAFTPQAHATIARREWLYKPAYIRANVSVTAGAGARGKSTLIVGEALMMVSGKSKLDITPAGKLRVWYVNLEDDMNELRRKFNAAMAHYEMTPEDIADRLYVESGCGREIVLAVEDFKRRAVLNRALLDKIRRTICKRRIDVVIFDPFVSLHRVSENDNGAIDLLVKALAGIAQETNCAMMLVHHTRKPNGNEGSVDDARGASALINAARYARVLNPMTADEASRLGVAPEKRGFIFRSVDGKTNLTPPAERSDWYRLDGFELGNGGGFETAGDNVGVVTRFVVPASQEADRLHDLTQMDLAAAFRDGGPWRLDSRAGMWAGDQLARHLGMSATATKADLNHAIRRAVDRGWLTVFTELVDSKPKEFVKLAYLSPVDATDGQIASGEAS